MADGFVRKIANYIEEKELLPDGSSILLGVSGGADSVCLLQVLHQLAPERRWKLYVLHVNHGLRPEASQDSAFVEKMCHKLEVPCHVVQADVKGYALEHRLSSEEAGRALRYALLEEECRRVNCQWIALAHNRKDRAETLLFNLFRGTGLTGMGSIPEKRGVFVRPLLGTSREEITEWLSGRNILWQEDRTNAEDLYTRNRIRHHILPAAAELVCPEAEAHLTEEAELLSLCAEFVDRFSREALKRCILEEKDERIVLSADAFQKEERLIRGQMILQIFRRLTGGRDITAKHVKAVEKLFDAQSGRMLDLPGNLRAARSFDRVIVECLTGEESGDFGGEKSGKWEYDLRAIFDRLEREKEIRVSLPPFFEKQGRVLVFSLISRLPEELPAQKAYTKYFDYDTIKCPSLRSRRAGDYLCIDERLHRKRLKVWFTENRIPVGERERMLLLADGDHIVWILGDRISSAFKVTERTERVLKVCLEA